LVFYSSSIYANQSQHNELDALVSRILCTSLTEGDCGLLLIGTSRVLCTSLVLLRPKMNQWDTVIRTYTHTYIHTYIHTYTHTHINTCAHYFSAEEEAVEKKYTPGIQTA
jgi:hypothetical protein